MEKLGVDEVDGNKVASADVTARCPRCTSKLEVNVNVKKCPKCGTAPFEGA